MKKLLIIILALVMVLSLTACGKDKKEEPIGMPNPMVEFESLEALNEKYNVNLQHPGVMGVTNEAFYGIDSEYYGLAQYNFDLGDYSYCFRGTAGTFDDISGIYNGDNTVFYTEAQGEPEEDMFASLDTVKAARWFIGEKQYVLSVTDNGKMEEETFKGIAAEMKALTDDREATDLSGFVGSYQDSFSQRANLEVTDNGDETLKLIVTWSSSASEVDQWEMNAVYTPDGALYYKDGVHTRVVFEEEISILEESQVGSFTAFDNGQLAWMGAADESCKDCVFEKIQ